ncbi:MAG: MBL fold metallo-hydrolase [Ardenticatenaceae bacterium]|nr:MBL fold metallo-hydrolase [Ardenticatenaceae bacterium]
MNPIRIELPTPFDVGSVNAFLFTEPEPVLVDTGVHSAENWAALLAGLNANGVALTDLRRIVITHPHVDHCGEAGPLAEASGAQVWASEIAQTWLVDPAHMWQRRVDYYAHHFLPFTGLPEPAFQAVIGSMRWAAETAVPVPRHRLTNFPLNGTLEMGGLPWQVLHMPGHSEYQTCFYQPDTRQFLAADMLLAKTPTPIVERPLDDTFTRIPALPKFLQSLDRVEALDIETVYPGHGDIFTNHRELIQQQRQRITARKEECLRLVRNGRCTIAQLTEEMYSHIPLRFRFSGLWMLVGYLDLLQAEGAVSEHLRDGIWHYTPAE